MNVLGVDDFVMPSVNVVFLFTRITRLNKQYIACFSHRFAVQDYSAQFANGYDGLIFSSVICYGQRSITTIEQLLQLEGEAALWNAGLLISVMRLQLN